MTCRDLRIRDRVTRGPLVRVTLDGQPFDAHEGEPVAAALWAAGLRHAGPSGTGPPFRVVFCAMGICQQCTLLHEGRRVESCQLPAREGMALQTGFAERDA